MNTEEKIAFMHALLHIKYIHVTSLTCPTIRLILAKEKYFAVSVHLFLPRDFAILANQTDVYFAELAIFQSPYF